MTASSLPTAVVSPTSLDQRLAREERALALRSIVTALLAGLAIALVVLAISALLLDGGRWLALPRIVPIFAWLSGLVGAIAVAVILRRRDRARLTRAAVATSIEREQALRTGSLRGAIEVAATGVLGARAASDIARKLAPQGSLAPQLTRSFNRTVGLAGVLALVGVGAFAMSARATEDGLSALRHPVDAWRGMLLPALDFVDLPADVPRGMPLTVRISASGRPRIDVQYSAAGEAARDTTLSVDAVTGEARLALGAVTAPVTIRVSDGRARDAVATIAVADRGWIGDVVLHAEYPGYLQRTNERLEPVPPIRVPQGTVVRVRAMLRGGATDARLSNGTDTIVLLVGAGGSGDDATVSGALTASRDAEWRWISSPTHPKDAGPLPVEVPEALQFAVVPDLSPRIAIVAPATDTAIGATGAVGIIVQASDDHGLSGITLSIWKERANEVTGVRERVAIAEPGSSVWDGGATLPLSGRDLEPGDKLHVVAIATDDSPWRQATQSAELILRVPSLSEQRAMARDLADSLAARASRVAAAEKQLHQQTVDASKSRDLQAGGKPDGSGTGGDAKSQAQKNAMSFAAAERAKELGRQQQALGEKIDSLRQQSRDLEDRLKSAGALDTAMQNRMRDIQKMLREAMTPEMQKQLQDLQKSTENLSGTQAQQSLEQLATQQKQMREQLEKSAEMLKRAALEGAMQTLSDEARELASEQQKVANNLQGKQNGQNKAGEQGREGTSDPKTLADRSRALEREVDRLAKRLDDAGAKPGAAQTKAAQPNVDKAADAMQRAAQQASQQNGQQQQAGQQDTQQSAQQQNAQQQASQQGQKTAADSSKSALQDRMNKALADLQQKDKDQSAQAAKSNQQVPPGGSGGSGSQAQKQQGSSGDDAAKAAQQTSQAGNKDGTRAGEKGQQQGAQQQQGGQQGQQAGQQGQQGGQNAAQSAQDAANSMSQAAKQLSDARESQVDAWKGELSQQLDKSINETQQLARQQSQLEERAKKDGASSVRGEQGAVQQGVQQAAERLEEAGRNSSLLSQRSQKAMGEAQRKVQEATQALNNAQQGGGQDGAQSAMREASEALNQALGSLVRDRERVNNAQSASGFTEMMEQLKQLAQQQGSLNGQMQGLSMLPGGKEGQQAQQQSRVLARQQREVARSLQDVSDADATGRTDALAKEAQQIAQQLERQGLDPNVAARQQQLYRRLLDAGKFLEQDERDEQGPREARAGSGEGRGNVNGSASGKNASKFAPPTWNELRGLGPEERRLVIEYFRRINGNNP